MIKRHDSKYWEDLIKEYKSSGLPLSKWCIENNVSKYAMRYHMYKKVPTATADPIIDYEEPKLMEISFNEYQINPSTVIKLGPLEINVDQQNIDIVTQLIKKIIYD